jgi:flagellar biosynthesis protein FliP
VIVSLPFKILIFVLVDGWGKIVEQLMLGFQAA